MITKRRRQTRNRNWSPTVYDPWQHNADAAMRKALRRLDREMRQVRLSMLAMGRSHRAADIRKGML